MQIMFTDPAGRKHVLNARDAAAVAHLVTTKHAEGWVLSPDNPPIVHAAVSNVAFACSGEFLDPQGYTMTLRATDTAAFRVLVTRKLAAGWKRIPKSPPVAPLKNETQVALGPQEKPEKPNTALMSRDVLEYPTTEEREAAVKAAIARANAGDFRKPE